MSLKSPALLSLATLLTPMVSAAPLTFTVDGVEARGGTLYIGVQTEDQFMKWEGVAGEEIAAPTDSTYTVTFDLDAGDYSISVWHDVNNNGAFDMTESGMPAEGWAMTNASKLRGAPSFDVVKVSLDAAGQKVRETIIYP